MMARRLAGLAAVIIALTMSSCSRLQQNSATFDPDGTAHIQRVGAHACNGQSRSTEVAGVAGREEAGANFTEGDSNRYR
jgi:hypothetical protein